MPKNVETIIQLHSFHMLSRLFSKSFKLALAVCELRTSGVQAGLRKDRGTRGQIANIHWVIEEAREFQKNINCCFIDYPRAFYCVDHSELWKILEKMGVAHHLTCLLRTLYVGQETTVRTRHRETDWFKIGKEGWQGCILSTCLFNFYPEYIMPNARLDELQPKSRLLGEISTTLDMQITILWWQKMKRH